MTDQMKIEIITKLLNLVVVPLLGLLVGYICTQINQNMKSEKGKRAVSLAHQAISQAVAETAQTYVDRLKAQGGLAPEQVAEANRLTLTRAKGIIGEHTYRYLKSTMGDAEGYLKSLMELYVRLDKFKLPAEEKDKVPR